MSRVTLWRFRKTDNLLKILYVTGPDGIEMAIDFDDVQHETVKRAAKKMVAILNKHWKEKKK